MENFQRKAVSLPLKARILDDFGNDKGDVPNVKVKSKLLQINSVYSRVIL